MTFIDILIFIGKCKLSKPHSISINKEVKLSLYDSALFDLDAILVFPRLFLTFSWGTSTSLLDSILVISGCVVELPNQSTHCIQLTGITCQLA